MDLRSTFHSKPWLTVLVCLGLVGGVGYFLISRARSTPYTQHYPVLGNYYTADEGQTWIPDNWVQVPPFDRNGQTYVRVFLFAGADGKPFVGYLEKFTPQAAGILAAQEEDRFRVNKIQEFGDRALLVKRPGDAKWVAKDSNEGRAMMSVLTPGLETPAKPVLPDLSLEKH